MRRHRLLAGLLTTRYSAIAWDAERPEDRALSARRREFVPPIVIAVAFTMIGEMMILLFWGILMFPSGSLGPAFAWTFTCGLAMGATIGALINVIVTGRLEALAAAIWSGVIYFIVLAACTGLCFRIDLAVGSRFGAEEAPALFILGGLIPALVTTPLYGWLLHSDTGRRMTGRCSI